MYIFPCFSGHPQSNWSGDGPENESTSGQQTEHAQGGPADEQTQSPKYSQVNIFFFCKKNYYHDN